MYDDLVFKYKFVATTYQLILFTVQNIQIKPARALMAHTVRTVKAPRATVLGETDGDKSRRNESNKSCSSRPPFGDNKVASSLVRPALHARL